MLPSSPWSAYQLRQFKKLYRQVQRLKHSTAKDPDKRAAKQEDVRAAHRTYLEQAEALLARVRATRVQLVLSKFPAVLFEEIDLYLSDAERQIDQIRRRVLWAQTTSRNSPCFPIADEMMHLAGGHPRARAHLTCVLDQVTLNDRLCGKSIKGLLGTGAAPLTSPPLRISADRPADACLAAPEVSSLAHPGHPTGQTAIRLIALQGSPAHRSSSGAGIRSFCWGQFAVRQPNPHRTFQSRQRSRIMNNIIWLVGAVVIVLFVLGYFGLR